jgi:hypothetical protein
VTNDVLTDVLTSWNDCGQLKMSNFLDLDELDTRIRCWLKFLFLLSVVFLVAGIAKFFPAGHNSANFS